jgi:hypothetical protein
MTFTPQVLTQTDNNNTFNGSIGNYIGTSTITTGFNTIILTIQGTINSDAGGIQIQFSDDNLVWITPYTDTYFAPNIFTKTYLIIKKYYRILYTNPTIEVTNVTSRLSTDLDSSITQNNSITIFDNNVENTLDAFGKLRVSNPTTLLDLRFPGQNTGSESYLKNNLQICSDSSGNYNGSYSDSKLIVSASGAGYYISQSRNYCNYQPGKSLLFMGSGVLYPGINGYTTRIGYFNNEYPSGNTLIVYNGLYFQHSEGVYSVNIASSSTTTSTNQSLWNIDKMDGTGTSGLNLNFTKAQLFVIDMEWLSVGRVRFGFYAYGRIQYCHQVTNINSLIQPYTTSINLPICYSIHNNNNTLSLANNFTQICATVISEGGYTPLGKEFSVSNGTTSISIQGGIEEPILFLRGNISNTNYYNQNIIPKSLSMICSSTNDLILYKLVLFLAGTYIGTNPTWVNVNINNSVAQYAQNLATGYNSTNGIIIDQGYFYGRGTNTIANLNNIFTSQLIQITSDIKYNSDILVLTATFCSTSVSSTNVYGTLSWQEVY